ncbi:helix-turn-helix transcriptional regulator [Streptomyces sp. NEAU-Y11]|uniref:helix-turn-helix transcriptional regulator n=1 Tax=Streptomyces cucumeris TaxID=2962890 RepID=UPI0020C83426|nr:helix-turn-helix domain-containing protein [Streptomyces sp. NEAU-Y11]MCP9205557.1 helix-turn-helix domain-containing protein [Streptomyces sp. NEAU-Y11]
MSEVDSPFLTTRELARLLRRTPEAIRSMRHRGQGPRGQRVGRGVLYRRSEVDAWLEANAAADPLGQRAA